MDKKLVFVCQNVDCRTKKATEVMETLSSELAADSSVEVRPYMCFGACHDGPNVVIYPDKVWYAGVTPDNASEVVAYLRGGAAPAYLDTISPVLKEMIFQLLDAGIY